MKKTAVTVSVLALLMLLTIATPVFAEKPTVVPCRFTMVGASFAGVSPGKVWWTDDNTILHVRGARANGLLFISPTVQIGTMENVVDLDYNKQTGKGNAVETWQMTFIAPVNYYTGQPTGTPNPYGLGTLEGITNDKVTSIFGLVTGEGVMLPGDVTGFLVATHGTGDFEKAKLSADIIGRPTLLPSPPYPPNEWDEFVYVGWDGTSPPVPTGVLTFYS